MRRVYVLAAGNERGGAATHLVTFAQALVHTEVELKSQVTFLIAGEGDLYQRLIGVTDSLQRISGHAEQAVREASAILRADQGVALHAHGPRWNVIGSRVARRARCPWTSTIHSHPQLDYLTSKWKSVVLPSVHRRALRTAAGLFVVNLEFAPLFPGKTCRFVPNAVEPVRLPEPVGAYRQALRERLGVAEETAVVGVAARLDRVKDLDTMVQGVALLASTGVHLAVAGDGPERGHLEHLASELSVSDRVHFLGYIQDVDAFYAGLDAHVLTSRSEGTPSAVLEAGWIGIPNVGTDIPGLRHLIEDGETGALVPVGDAVALAAALSALLANPELGKQYAQRFADKVLPRYVPEKMVAAYFEGYETFFGERV